MDREPMQYISMPVESPLASSLFPIEAAFDLNFPSMSSMAPMREPMARLTINSTGYWLFGILEVMEFMPIPEGGKPHSVIQGGLVFLVYSFLRTLPSTLPARMVQVFTIVPVNVFHSFKAMIR